MFNFGVNAAPAVLISGVRFNPPRSMTPSYESMTANKVLMIRYDFELEQLNFLIYFRRLHNDLNLDL